MADLEKSGYLEKTHTSSGRIPSEKGYRYYVDELLKDDNISLEEIKYISDKLETKVNEIEDLTKITTSTISEITHYTTVAIGPSSDGLLIEEIKFVLLGPRMLMAIILTNTGMVKETIIKFDEDITEKQVETINYMFNQKLKGQPLEIIDAPLEEYLINEMKYSVKVIKPIIEHNGMVVASLGNISAVVGAAKSKKTFLCTALVGGLLAEHGDFGITPRLAKVLWVDTEQSALHARKVQERIHRLAGWDDSHNTGLLHTLTLREVEPKARAEILYMAIELYRPTLVVVDGISDLMYNTNDIAESDSIVGKLMALSTEFNCHILCVLHTNPDSDKARGHIGSTLQRKAETMIYVRKVGERSVVEPQFCRNEEFAPFAFHITEEGLPEECEMPNEREEQLPEENICVQLMRENYPNGVERKVLTTKIVDVENINRALARVKITRAIAKGLLMERGGVLYLP